MRTTLHRVIACAALAHAIWPCGCSSASKDTAAVDAGTPTDGATPSGRKAIPADLQSFEANGEGMCEAPVTPDWKTAGDIYTQASGTWGKLKVTLTADGADAKTITKVDGLLAKYSTDVTQKLVREAETDANSINALVPDFFELYDSKVPSDAFRLDAAFRLLEIQGEHSDFTTGATALEATKTVWARLKPSVTKQAATRADIPSAATVVADIDAALASAAGGISGKNAADTMKAAKSGLDLVDVIEQAFK